MSRKESWLLSLVTLGVIILALMIITSPGFAQSKKTQGATPTAAAPAPIAVQEHEVEGVEVALLEVKRTSGNTVTIKWQYRNKTAEKKPLNHGASMGMDSQRFAKDAYFLDGANKKYAVMTDDQGKFMAAKHDQFVFAISMAPKQVVTTWARFAAPPSDVEKVTIHLPGAPPFDDIAISK